MRPPAAPGVAAVQRAGGARGRRRRRAARRRRGGGRGDGGQEMCHENGPDGPAGAGPSRDGGQLGGCGTGACAGSVRLTMPLEPVRGKRDVRERRPERLVVAVDPVAERDLLAALVRGQQRTGDHPQLDVGDIVGEATAVREPGEVAGEHAEAVLGGAGRHAEVELERVGRHRVRADLSQSGHAREQRLDDVGPVALLDAEVEQGVEEARRLRVEGEPAEVPGVVPGGRAVELVLHPDGDDHLVDQRVAEAGDLPPSVLAAVLVAADGHGAALGARPHADDGIVGLRVCDGLVVTRDLGLRHLEHERVRVVGGHVVLAAALVAEPDVGPAGLVDVDAVEHGAEVNEEGVVGRADEALAAALQAPHGAGLDRRVVRDGLRADVVRRHRHVVRDPL